MAATEVLSEPHAHRRRPFSTWVRKLANFKSSSDGDRIKRQMKKQRSSKLNNPYPQSGHVSHNHTHERSTGSFGTAQTGSHFSTIQSVPSSGGRRASQTAGDNSAVGTTNPEARSIKATSHGASSARTGGGGLESRRGGDSTFSSPAPSVRSLTTTLTTIQSIGLHTNTNEQGGTTSTSQPGNTQSIQFSQPFPTSAPASAIPPHLAPAGGPSTYTSATANNLLTDNASILTLASSSKRRRRRSMDTDASVRALAPSSVWGGSRESLPLSILSANIEGSAIPTTPGLYGSSSRMGAERNSIYSATGVAPAIASERNSIYTKQGDGASVRSGLYGHNRNDSIGGGAQGLGNTLAAPREVPNEREDQPEKSA